MVGAATTTTKITALYLAHLNPVTNAHVEIISHLQKEAEIVKVMPVVFLDGTREINSKSFPFSFETRRRMLESVFGDTIWITDDYAFLAPFKRYMPPIIAPRSWKLRKQILDGVRGDFFSYTGDKAEGVMLKIYRLKPRIGQRRQLSASTVKESMYRAALEDGGHQYQLPTQSSQSTWGSNVPKSVVSIIEQEWETVNKYAEMHDATRRIAGMKFPTEGWG